MKYANSELYDIGRIFLKHAVIGFDEFLENSYFNSILDNEYLMKRPLEEIAAWVLLDYEDFKEDAIDLIYSFLEIQNIDKDESFELIEILRDSYVSLFEIKKDGEDYKFHDLILDKNYTIEYTSALANVSNKWGIFRIFGPNKKKIVLQRIRTMVETEYFTFHSNLLKVFKELKYKEKTLKIDKEFLKANLLNFLSVSEVTNWGLYGNPYDDEFEFTDEDLKSAFYKEDLYALNDLKDFKRALSENDEEYILAFFDYTFSKIYEKYLEGDEKSFKDYDLDYFKIFANLCNGGDFSDQNQLIESVELVLAFYKKLSKMGREVKKPIESLQKVKKSIFDFIKMLDESIGGFYYDDRLPDLIVKNNPNYAANKFIENYDNFLTFLDINYVNLLKSGDLSPAMLRGFVEDAEILPTKYVKIYKNKHFPQIELYLFFTIIKSLTYLYNPGEVQEIILTDEADDYMSFDELKKYSIWIDSLSKEDFLKPALGDNYEIYKDLVLELFEKLLSGEDVRLSDYQEAYIPVIQILIDLDILEEKIYLKITKFGQALYDYYGTDKKKDNIIEVDFN
ncbi:hypothetical protein KQI68_01730 [Peptoniphilus sp. MSJ-1]|uniref:Uncharacterized protein n=1 Tax=Peptoniphilus ovalis TaxID=2841503 RepID=A0ABS6FER9_9FIRM|nr:hypothetical protein [Peptoniphilus ovalis]MBU5668553.1 hypothetical protein [Peptoniphilus ovalis]